MVPWLAEVSRIKMIIFTYICGYVCVYMNDGSLLSLSPPVCFFKILETTCRIDERKSQAFSYCSFRDL